MELTPDIIAGAGAVLLSVLATYVPGFNTWHAKLSEEQKKLLWMGLILTTVVGAIAWGCSPEAGCDISGWRDYLKTFIGALLLGIGANQGVHHLLPVPDAVKAAKEEGTLKRGHR